jgi:hypothetical protein
MFFTEDKRQKNLFWVGIHPSLRGRQWKNPSLSDTPFAGENEIQQIEKQYQTFFKG